MPAWRHALINYPHPLLKRGLVVLDTPGLNAIGAEPELTLGLLPSAHATVFLLGADTGVTKSDLAIWRDHLGAQALARFVVLNKIDTLADPLSTPEQIEAQIEQQQRETAHTLACRSSACSRSRRAQALAARVSGDDAGAAESRLPQLEAALGAQLLPQRARCSSRSCSKARSSSRARSRAASATSAASSPSRCSSCAACAARAAQGAPPAPARRGRDGRIRALHDAAAGAALGARAHAARTC